MEQLSLFPIGPPKPKTISFAGLNASAAEIMALRAHIEEAKTDPDYDVVISYEYTWGDDGSLPA